MIIEGKAVTNNPVNISEKQKDTEKAEEVFKKIFLERMVSEMLETTDIIPSANELQKEFYTGKMSEILADKLLQSTDIRWEQILGKLENSAFTPEK